jgi:hypothetical protein
MLLITVVTYSQTSYQLANVDIGVCIFAEDQTIKSGDLYEFNRKLTNSSDYEVKLVANDEVSISINGLFVTKDTEHSIILKGCDYAKIKIGNNNKKKVDIALVIINISYN